MTRYSIPNQENEKKEEQEQNPSVPPPYSSDSDSDSESSSPPPPPPLPSSSPLSSSVPESEGGPVRIPSSTFVPSSLSFPSSASSEEKSPEVISLKDEPASVFGSSSAAPQLNSVLSSLNTDQDQKAKEDPEDTRRTYDAILQNTIIKKEQEEAQARLLQAEEQRRTYDAILQNTIIRKEQEEERRKATEAIQRIQIVREQEERRAQERDARLALEREAKKQAERQRYLEEERREQEAREEAQFQASIARIPASIEFRARRDEENRRRTEEQQRLAREDQLKIAERQRRFLAEQEEKERVEREKQQKIEFLTSENERLQRENREHLETISLLVKEKDQFVEQIIALHEAQDCDLDLIRKATETISRLEAEKRLRDQEMSLRNAAPVPPQFSSSSSSFSSREPHVDQSIVDKIMEKLVPKISSMIADTELNILERTSETEKNISRKIDRDSKKQLEDLSRTLNDVLAISTSSRALIEGQRGVVQENINQGRRVAVAVDEVKNLVLRGTTNIMAQNDLTKQTITALATALTEREVPQGLGDQEKEQIIRSLRAIEGDRHCLENRLSDQDAVLKDLSAQIRHNNNSFCDLKEDITNIVFGANQETSSQIMKLSSLIEAKSRGQFKLPNKARFNPCTLAVSSTGEFFVIDTTCHNLHLFDWQGLFVKTIGSEGEAPGQFYLPSSVSVSKNDEVLVCDKGNNRLQMFDAQGNLLHCFGPQDFPGLGLVTPFNACFDDRGYIYVCDKEQGRVFVFNNERKPLFSFSGPPTTRGAPFSPTDVLVHQDVVYISEYSSGRILLFSIEGELIKSLDRLGLKQPNGLALNSPTNELIISESGTCKIVLLDLVELTLSDVDREFEGAIEGIAIDLEGNLLVCDSTLHTIHSVPL